MCTSCPELNMDDLIMMSLLCHTVGLWVYTVYMYANVLGGLITGESLSVYFYGLSLH